MPGPDDQPTIPRFLMPDTPPAQDAVPGARPIQLPSAPMPQIDDWSMSPNDDMMAYDPEDLYGGAPYAMSQYADGPAYPHQYASQPALQAMASSSRVPNARNVRRRMDTTTPVVPNMNAQYTTMQQAYNSAQAAPPPRRAPVRQGMLRPQQQQQQQQVVPTPLSFSQTPISRSAAQRTRQVGAPTAYDYEMPAAYAPQLRGYSQGFTLPSLDGIMAPRGGTQHLRGRPSVYEAPQQYQQQPHRAASYALASAAGNMGMNPADLFNAELLSPLSAHVSASRGRQQRGQYGGFGQGEGFNMGFGGYEGEQELDFAFGL
jgi:hypothetical protein